jgi:hypothetical protein
MLKGFDFGLDLGLAVALRISDYEFPSLKGFDFGLDWKACLPLAGRP